MSFFQGQIFSAEDNPQLVMDPSTPNPTPAGVLATLRSGSDMTVR